jgi:hypothetical protein
LLTEAILPEAETAETVRLDCRRAFLNMMIMNQRELWMTFSEGNRSIERERVRERREGVGMMEVEGRKEIVEGEEKERALSS